MLKGLVSDSKVLSFGQPFNTAMLLGLTKLEVCILQNVAKKDAIIYGVDIRVLLRLIHLTTPTLVINITDDVRDCFARGQVPFEENTLKETVLACTLLFNWINNTHARIGIAYAARYIHACITRERDLPLIPLCMMELFDMTTWKTRADAYYRNVWQDHTVNMVAKRNIFVLCCRGTYVFEYSSGYSLGKNTLPQELKGSDVIWTQLDVCEGIFDMMVRYEKMIRTHYVVSPIGYKKHKVDGGGGGAAEVSQAGSYTKKGELFDKFLYWVHLNYINHHIPQPTTRSQKRMLQFYSRLLWILVEEPVLDLLHYEKCNGLMVVPIAQ